MALHNGKNQAFGYQPGAAATNNDAVNVVTKAISPAAGFVPNALSTDFRATARSVASVLGTGQNPDLLTQGPEAV